MESHKDNDGDSEKADWGMIFTLFKLRGFSDEEILKLSYPKFRAYLDNINNITILPIVIPYMGGAEDKKAGAEVETKEELFNIVADMNKEFI